MLRAPKPSTIEYPAVAQADPSAKGINLRSSPLALANKPPQALRQTKLMLKRGNEQAVAETIPYEMELFGERLRSDEAQTVIQAMMSRTK